MSPRADSAAPFGTARRGACSGLTWTISTALFSGPQAFTSVMAAFRHPAFRVVEAVIVACIAFHGINGLMMIAAERGWWKR